MMTSNVCIFHVAICWIFLQQVVTVETQPTVTGDPWVDINQATTLTCLPSGTVREFGWRKYPLDVQPCSNSSNPACPLIVRYLSPSTVIWSSLVDPNYYLFDETQTNFPLTIKSVTLEDESNYNCQANVGGGTGDEMDSTAMRVRVPSSAIAMTYNGASYSGGAAFRVVAGDNHSFTCSTPAVKPATEFTWILPTSFSTDQPLGLQTDSPNSGDSRLIDSSNTITVDIAKNPATVDLTCSATNKQDGSNITDTSITVTLEVRVPPVDVMISDITGDKVPGDQVDVTEGTPHTITCKVPGTRPAADIQWLINNVAPSSGISSPTESPSNGLINTTGTWTFTPLIANHRQVVKCVANTTESELPYPSAEHVINVFGPPDNPSIMGNTPLKEGEETKLVCSADRGYPNNWQLKWSNGTMNIDGTTTTPGDSSSSTNRYIFTSNLDVTPSREDNDKTIIKCAVERGSWVPGREDSYGPIDVQFCARTVNAQCPLVTAGNSATLSCTSESSNPETTLTWYKENDMELNGETPQVDPNGAHGGRVTTRQYTTAELTKDNNGEGFKCCATNNAIACTSNVCDMCTLNVQYPPDFSQPTKTPSDPVVEGGGIILTCTVDANPIPSDVTWQKQDSSAAFNSVYNDVTSRLTLSDVSREQAGYYMCRANNGVPTGDPNDKISDPVTVIVHYEVNITSKAMDEVGVKDGDDAVLTCVSKGNPMPVVTWYSPNGTEITGGMDEGKFLVTNLTTGGDGVFGFEITSTLTINEVDSQADYGTYTCRSSNGIGDEDSLNINVTGTRRPDQPTRVEITNRTVNSLSVKWTAGYNGGAEQSFNVSWCLSTSDSTEVFTPVTKETTSSVTGLEAYTEYEIRVYAQNEVGQNNRFASTTGYTLPEELGPGSVKFYKEKATVVISGLKENECIQLEVQYQGDATWQECGECITSDQTVTLTEWCTGSSQKQRRRAVGNVEAVLAKRCIEGLCSKAVVVNAEDQTPPPVEPDPTGLIVGATIGGVILIAIIIVLVVYLVRTSPYNRSGNRGDEQALNQTGKCVDTEAAHPRTDTQSPYQEITELEVFSVPANHGQGAALYGNVPAAHKAFPRDQLKIIKELGRGAFGRVLLAEAAGMTQVSKVTLVAVKTLKEAEDKSNKADMMQELDLMKKLPDHCNVVRLLGFCVEKDPPYIIVEYLSRGNLKDFLKDSRSKGGCVYGNLHGISKSLTSKDLMKFAKDVADGMAFISSQQCIHRDLAARNVLVAEDMTCKVSDFGLARDVMNIRVYERSSEGALPMRWMALESVVDEIYTTESDVWSYGVLMWEIVTLGARPYPAMTAKVMVDELQSGYRMPKPKHCQENLYEMMLRCWYEDPESRPTFKTISEELDKLIGKGKEYISIQDLEENIYEVVLKDDAGEKV